MGSKKTETLYKDTDVVYSCVSDEKDEEVGSPDEQVVRWTMNPAVDSRPTHGGSDADKWSFGVVWDYLDLDKGYYYQQRPMDAEKSCHSSEPYSEEEWDLREDDEGPSFWLTYLARTKNLPRSRGTRKKG
jgi:hypothetical protein